MSDGPVFIGGLAFSGKTPLRIALSAHSNLELTRRTAMWTTYYGRFGDLARADNLDRCLTAMLSAPAIARLGPDRADIERRFAMGPATYARLFATIHLQHAEGRGKRRWGDQMGMLEQHADLVLSAYPTARMIHMIRDPRTRYHAAGRRHRQLPGKLGWETARWRHSAGLALRNGRRFGDRYRVVRYEQLCAAPEATLRAVCTFLDEAYEPATLEALRDLALPPTPRDGVDPTTRPDAVSAFVERHTGPFLRAHRYAVSSSARRRRMSAPASLLHVSCDRVGIALWEIARSTGRTAQEVG